MIVDIVQEYRARCLDCKFNRGFGQAILTADVVSAKHALTRNHAVRIVKGDTIIRVVNEKRSQRPPETEDPPF